MSIISQANKQAPSKFIDCNTCSMRWVCQPLNTDKHTFDLTANYLTRQIPVHAPENAKVHSTQKIGSVLIENNQDLTAIYAVCSGVFKLYQYNADGSEKVVGFRFPGELIGEDAIFPKKYNYNAIAIGESSVCKVSVNQLNACGQLAPELQTNLIHLLTKQSFLQQRNAQALIGKKSADSLLAAFLFNLHQRNINFIDNKREVDLIISRNDIANFLGIRRETLSRLLSKFQQEGLIELQGKKLTLLSLASLEKTANN